jgi:hypothetical protein
MNGSVKHPSLLEYEINYNKLFAVHSQPGAYVVKLYMTVVHELAK